jgi:hypothetical protein
MFLDMLEDGFSAIVDEIIESQLPCLFIAGRTKFGSSIPTADVARCVTTSKMEYQNLLIRTRQSIL